MLEWNLIVQRAIIEEEFDRRWSDIDFRKAKAETITIKQNWFLKIQRNRCSVLEAKGVGDANKERFIESERVERAELDLLRLVEIVAVLVEEKFV